MKIRRLIGVLSATVALAAPTLFVAGTAGAAPGGSVQRYESLTFQVSMSDHYLYYFTAVLNPSDGSFVGTGYINFRYDDAFVTIWGTYSVNGLSYTATQFYGSSANTGTNLILSSIGAVRINGGTGSGNVNLFIGNRSWTRSIVVSHLVVTMYANHGAFVSQNPGAASAMLCLGMPIQSMAC